MVTAKTLGGIAAAFASLASFAMADDVKVRPAHLVWGDSVIGATVVDNQGTEIGTIDNLIIGLNSSRILCAFVDPSIETSTEADYIAVPWEALGTPDSEGKVALCCSRDKFAAGPAIVDEERPDFNGETWLKNLHEHYGTSCISVPSASKLGEIVAEDAGAEKVEAKAVTGRVVLIETQTGFPSGWDELLVTVQDSEGNRHVVNLGPVWCAANRGIDFTTEDEVSFQCDEEGCCTCVKCGESACNMADESQREARKQWLATSTTRSDEQGGMSEAVAYDTFIGTALYSAEKAHIGEVDRILVDCANGRVACAVVGYGGFAGLGEKKVALPVTAFRYYPEPHDEKNLLVDVHQKQFEALHGIENFDLFVVMARLEGEPGK